MQRNDLELFKKFTDYCDESDPSDTYNVSVVADLYLKTTGKNNLVSEMFRLVNKTTPRKTPTGNSEWSLDKFIINTTKATDGLQRIHLMELNGKSQIPVFIILRNKLYDKKGERMYYYRIDGGEYMQGTAHDIIVCGLNTFHGYFPRYIYNCLNNYPRSTLIESMRQSRYAATILDVNYANYDLIPRDFTIVYNNGKSHIKVHKFIAGVFSEFMRIAIYGTGAIKGVDTIDLSGFASESVEWVADLIYNPNIIFNALKDEDWILLNYLHIDIDKLVSDTLSEIGL